jgi:hypothetical protein
MATTNLNTLIRAAARKLKDERTSPASSDDTGHVYSSALLTEYANRAVRDFLRDSFKALGKDRFAELFPEYIKQSGVLTLASGLAAKPSDAFLVIDLFVSDLSLKFDPLGESKVAQVQVSDAGLDNASATHPKFWDEDGSIKTLGVTSGSVIARYISIHPDLSVITTATSAGTVYTTAANLSYTAATKLLIIDGELHIFDTNIPTNQVIQLWTSTTVYTGRVSSYHITIGGDAEVYLDGENLPASDIVPSNLLGIAISGSGPNPNDIKLKEYWHGEILERMVQMGEADAVRISSVQ